MKTLLKSLADFQQEVPVIHKGTSGYGYSYADLPTIFEAINPLLKKHKLGFTQLVGSGDIKTIIFHTETGETLETSTSIPQGVQLKGMNDFQVLGSAITYIRRYALSSALGLVTDKDTDASGEQTTKAPEADLPWLNLFDKAGNKTKTYLAIEKALADGKQITMEQLKSKNKISKQTALELEQNFKIK
jgi:prophage DNA circulation protein